ncbi:hypothetical protein [Moorena sp. SIO3F7]|uniref:hypothetical protein n=1 Tax=Moorena sp. SIO3F7 TaxID=2607839 RepID=UPI0014013058|nr:hypothetical protein [Moorena sp. SIO3F7]NEO11726.1 hypothetical protein [Moorena sp. SIO3E8]NEP98259.1 hypothetical protein [Moorena sp. SIO3F7]
MVEWSVSNYSLPISNSNPKSIVIIFDALLPIPCSLFPVPCSLFPLLNYQLSTL